MNPTKRFLSSRPFIIALAILFIIGAFVEGVYLGYHNRPEVDKVIALQNKEPLVMPDNVDFEPFWRAWNILQEKYTDADKTDNQARVWGAIKGLAEAYGDPYTTFMPPEETKLFDTEISGNFEGVGMEVGIRDDALTVVAPLKGNPAEKAGVQSGDRILKINGEPSIDLSVEQAVKKIRGKKGTAVVLTLLREKKGQFDVTIVRDTVTIPTVDAELRPDGVFVIQLYNFSAQSDRLFRNALQQFVDSGSDKLILDLRGNPGGYLESSVEIASWFLPSGLVVVEEDYGGDQEKRTHRSRGYNPFTDKLKMAVLVDGGSASASEILAGALSEHGKATLVGSKTFGKGSVQELVKLTPDTNLKITIAKWLTPKGNTIAEKGITPQYEIKRTQEDVDKGRDPQLDKAVQILLGK